MRKEDKEIWHTFFKEHGNGWWWGYTSRNSPVEFLKPMLKAQEERYKTKKEKELALKKAI